MHKSASLCNLRAPFDIDSRERTPGQDSFLFLDIMQELRVFIKEKASVLQVWALKNKNQPNTNN